MPMDKSRSRTRGSMMAEVSMALYIMLFFFAIPLMNLATIALRASFLYIACHVATIEAARATTFETNPVGSYSSKNLASMHAPKTASQFTGVTVESVVTSILITDLTTMTQTRRSSKLSSPAEVGVKAYQIEVRVNGKVDPIIAFNFEKFLSVPGLTAPIALTFADRQMCENPQGLTR